jgi:hypothetical protein
MQPPKLWENPAFITRVDEWRLSKCSPQNAIDWTPGPWIAEFPEYSEFLNNLFIEHLGFLDREILKDTVAKYAERDLYVEGFLAVMIWGYAADPRGPFRTKRVLSQSNAAESIEASFRALSESDVYAAYEKLETNGPKFLGPAFATKYLYFAYAGEGSLTPLILDSLVSEGLKKWGGATFSSTSVTAKTYSAYLKYMSQAAAHLGVTPEELEFLVFSETAKQKGNQSWSNRASSQLASESEIESWAILLAAEILLRDPNLVVLYSQPGGGQYECLSIRELEKRTGLEIDLNIAGSIHIFSPTPNTYSWEELISRGVSRFCELLAPHYQWHAEVNLDLASQVGKSLRAIVAWKINEKFDTRVKIRSLVCDNSAYGISINKNAFQVFQGAAEDIEAYPELSRLPNEAWFWSIEQGDQIIGLFDTYKGVHYFPQGGIQKTSWPISTGKTQA